MFLIWTLLSAAFAGELMVTTATPVVVKVDDTAIEYTPGTMVAQVSGIDGIHKVEIVSVTGKSKALMNVSVPKSGGVAMAFDGMNLVMASAGANQASAAIVTETETETAAAPAPKAPTAMSTGAFRALLSQVDDASFSDDKIAAVRTAAGSNWFTIDQVGQLVDAMDFSDGKVGVVKICKDKVVDPENAFQLGSHFSFSADKEEALGLFQ